MDPRSHSQLCNEDIASLGKQDRRLRRNHFYLRVSLHHFLYACQGQLMDFVVMVIRFKMINSVLPICGQDVARSAR